MLAPLLSLHKRDAVDRIDEIAGIHLGVYHWECWCLSEICCPTDCHTFTKLPFGASGLSYPMFLLQLAMFAIYPYHFIYLIVMYVVHFALYDWHFNQILKTVLCRLISIVHYYELLDLWQFTLHAVVPENVHQHYNTLCTLIFINYNLLHLLSYYIIII